MWHKNCLFNFHFKIFIIWNTIKVKILPNITFLRNRLLFIIVFFAAMFVCLIYMQNTRCHVSYHPLPAKLLATLTLKKKNRKLQVMAWSCAIHEVKIWNGVDFTSTITGGGGGCGREGELGTLNFRRPGMPFWNGSRERPGHHSSCIRRGFATQRWQP